MARAVFEASERAPRELAAAVKRLGIKAGLELARRAARPAGRRNPTSCFASEIDERRAAGLDASWVVPAADRPGRPRFAAAGAMRLHDCGFVDPYSLTLGFLAAAIKRGVKVYERSRGAARSRSTARTRPPSLDGGGAITTENLIVCIGEPTDLFKPLKRHLRHEDRYAVLTEPLSAAVRAELGQRAAIVCRHRDARRTVCGSPPTIARSLPAPTRSGRPSGCASKTLVQRTGQLMYELSRLYPAISGAMPAYGWDVPLAHPVDGVLYAGAHRNFPHHLFAFGTSHDPAHAYLASRIMLRSIDRQTRKRRRVLFVHAESLKS